MAITKDNRYDSGVWRKCSVQARMAAIVTQALSETTAVR